MTCQRCRSVRVAHISAAAHDLVTMTVGDADQDGYLDESWGLGPGEISFRYCLDCGQIQDQFPRPHTPVELEQIKATSLTYDSEAQDLALYFESDRDSDPETLALLMAMETPQRIASAVSYLVTRKMVQQARICLSLLDEWDHYEELVEMIPTKLIRQIWDGQRR